MKHLDVEAMRKEFPVVSRLAYFNTGAEGPQPSSALRAQSKIAQQLAAAGPATVESRRIQIAVARGTRSRVAKLLGAGQDEIALGHSTSHGICLVASGLDWRAGDEVIFDDLEHASGIAPWLHYEVRYGITPVCVRASGGNVSLDSIRAAMTDRTRLICMSHVAYSTGVVLPVDEICEMARGRGVLTLVDGAQSAGRIAVEVKELGCDAYAVPGHKWLLGPPGTGALYLSANALSKLSPAQVAWASIKSDDLSSLKYALREDAGRFELASMNAPLFAGLNASYDLLDGIGWDAVAAHSEALATRLIAGLERMDDVSVLTPSDAASRAGLVTFTLPSDDLDRVADALCTERDIVVRVIPFPRALRAALHVFNTEGEVDRLLGAISVAVHAA